MKRIFLILSLFAVMANLYATDVISVIRQKGWLETAMLQGSRGGLLPCQQVRLRFLP